MTRLTSAGFSTEKSRTGLGSLKLTFSCGDDDCEVPCPNFVIDKETGLVLVQPNNPREQATVTLTEECCTYHGFNYGPTKFSELYKKTLSKEALELTLRYEEIINKKYYESIGTTACFWCLPAIPICDFTSYFQTIVKLEGVQGIIDILVNDGIINPNDIDRFLEQWNSNPEEVLIKMIKYYDKIYEGYCLVIHDDFKVVSEECCKIRGGEWTEISGVKGTKENDVRQKDIKNTGGGVFKCVIPKEIPPEPNPCVCELPEYCDYKPTVTLFTNGFEMLEQCGPGTDVLANMTRNMVDEWSTWRGQRDAYMKAQNQSMLNGGEPGTTLPPTPVPTPIPGLEFWTGYDTWKLIEYSNGCYDSFYGWVPTLDSSGNPTYTDGGEPIGQIITPCPSENCDGFEDGTVIGTDYEDIGSSNRQKRDAALRAKNELSLATMPFFMANESLPYYQINKCKDLCGKDCTDCGEPTTQCDEVQGSQVARNCDWLNYNFSPFTLTSSFNLTDEQISCVTTENINGSNVTAYEIINLNGGAQSIQSIECCRKAIIDLGLNPDDNGRKPIIMTDINGIEHCFSGIYTKSLYE
jgi:hypothetical protein